MSDNDKATLSIYKSEDKVEIEIHDPEDFERYEDYGRISWESDEGEIVFYKDGRVTHKVERNYREDADNYEFYIQEEYTVDSADKASTIISICVENHEVDDDDMDRANEILKEFYKNLGLVRILCNLSNNDNILESVKDEILEIGRNL